MDTESQRIYDRIALHKLMEREPQLNPPQLAKQLNRSERWARKWCRRFKATSKPSFEMYRSRSRAPKIRRYETSENVKDAICDLRVALSEQYHRKAGADLIKIYMQKEGWLPDGLGFVPKSKKTITRILRERGYIQNAPKHQHEPLPLCPPMEEWEMDFCEIRLVDGRFEFFLVVDRGTSRMVYLEGGEGYRADSALEALMRLFLMCGMPKRLRFDRDPRFVWSWSADSFPAPMVKLLHVLGVEPVICPARKPWKKPYVERCIRTFKEEWLGRFSLETMADCYEALEAFPQYHNAERIHMGRACKGRTPDKAFPTLPILPYPPETVQPNTWLNAQHGRVFRRRIRANGTLQVDKNVYYVDQKLAKRAVLVHLDAKHRCLRVTLEGVAVPKVLPLQDLQPESMLLFDYLKHLKEEATSIAFYRETLWRKSGEAA